jgi:hypothetical protein
MSPTHTRKGGRLYRYYVSQTLLQGGANDAPHRRLPAGEVEDLVLAQVRALLRQPEIIVGTWRAARAEAPDLTEDEVRDALRRLDPLWDELFPGEQERIVRLLVERTRESLNRAIAAVAPGRQINVIGRTIESFAKRFDYGVVRDFTGHGIGRAFHSGLVIPHYDAAPAYGDEMKVGMVFTIEPMLTLGTHHWALWPDDWTVLTKDKSITAQFEHTLVVTETGADILTLP